MYETLKQAGYAYQENLGDGTHMLLNLETGQSEIWGNSKNHASYGLIYKNTHLEFCSSQY